MPLFSKKDKEKEREMRRANAYSQLKNSNETKSDIVLQISSEQQIQKIPCRYCGCLVDVKESHCPHCMAPIK